MDTLVTMGRQGWLTASRDGQNRQEEKWRDGRNKEGEVKRWRVRSSGMEREEQEEEE